MAVGVPPLASRSTRLSARLLDGLLCFAVALPGAIWLVIAALGSASLGHGPRDDTPVYLAESVVLISLLSLSIYQWKLLATRGQTLGKKWMNIRILRQDGSPVTFVRAVAIREWVFLVLWVSPVLVLVDILAIFGIEQRCLHDRFSGTKVIASAS